MRTNTDAVKAVLAPGGDYDTRRAPDLTPFIAIASSVVDDVEVAASGAYSANKLLLLETWLAAHFYKQSDKDFTSRSTGGASGSFAGQTGMRLESTLYGQSALALDSLGYLTNVATGGIVQVGGVWLGKPTNQQTHYHDRT